MEGDREGDREGGGLGWRIKEGERRDRRGRGKDVGGSRREGVPKGLERCVRLQHRLGPHTRLGPLRLSGPYSNSWRLRRAGLSIAPIASVFNRAVLCWARAAVESGHGRDSRPGAGPLQAGSSLLALAPASKVFDPFSRPHRFDPFSRPHPDTARDARLRVRLRVRPVGAGLCEHRTHNKPRRERPRVL